jgi:hypothetical protein
MKEANEQHVQDFKEVLSHIEDYGCHITLIEADNYLPAFVYSIGLYKKFNHPEIICFGLKVEVMAAIINDALDMIKQGKTFVPGVGYDDFLNGYNIYFIEVNKKFYTDYLGYAGRFYDTFDFPTLQLVWPDKESNFPWDEAYNPNLKFRQPLLDRNTDFKFYEERNLGVYTTQQALSGDSILYVYHNVDGDWEFYTSSEPDLNDAKLVCLEELIKLDPSLNTIYHLQFGWAASRGGQGEEWRLEELPEEEESS